MATPIVSVCIPAYNAADCVVEAIESVLAQSWGDLELVVVDDASTDATPELVRAHGDERVRLYVNPRNVGEARAYNRALALSRGELIKFLDADDRLDDECLAELARPFEASPAVGLTFSRRRIELEQPDDPDALRWKEANAELHSGFGEL